MKHQIIVDKEEFDRAIQDAETKGYWKAVCQLFEDKGNYQFDNVGSYNEYLWKGLIEDIRRGRKYK